MEEVRAFKTKDGEYFDNMEEAEAHELEVLFSKLTGLEKETIDSRLPFKTYTRGAWSLAPVQMMMVATEYVDELRLIYKTATIKSKLAHNCPPVELDALIYAAENSAHFGEVLAYLEEMNPSSTQVAEVKSIR